MIAFDPLTATLLDLARAVAPANIPLTVGGGFGLYLKQEQLRHTQARTLLAEMPEPRATNDIDLFLRVDILARLETMQRLADTLQTLGFEAVDAARYFQWLRPLAGGHEVKLDLLVGPLGEFRQQLKTGKPPRVRPKGNLRLHAHLADEAIEIDSRSSILRLQGPCSDGVVFAAEIHLPHAFTYLLMKLFAFDDRKHDDSANAGRHHALDLYRIVAMMTEMEYQETLALGKQYENDRRCQRARQIIEAGFSAPTGLGLLRLREHNLFRATLQMSEFTDVLAEVFFPQK